MKRGGARNKRKGGQGISIVLIIHSLDPTLRGIGESDVVGFGGGHEFSDDLHR